MAEQLSLAFALAGHAYLIASALLRTSGYRRLRGNQRMSTKLTRHLNDLVFLVINAFLTLLEVNVEREVVRDDLGHLYICLLEVWHILIAENMLLSGTIFIQTVLNAFLKLLEVNLVREIVREDLESICNCYSEVWPILFTWNSMLWGTIFTQVQNRNTSIDILDSLHFSLS